MTQEIMEMARQAGIDEWWDSGNEQREVLQEHLESFAKLVAAKAWSEGYRQGIVDERTSEDNIGIAGFGMKVEPNRENPYITRTRGEA